MLLYAVFISWYTSLCCVYILICFFMLCLYLDMLLYAVFLSWYASLCSVYILICFFMLCLYLDILLYEFHISFILGFMWSVPEGGLSPHTDTHQTRNADNFLHFAYFAYFNLFLRKIYVFITANKNPTARNSEKGKIVSKLFCANCRLWPFSECIFFQTCWFTSNVYHRSTVAGFSKYIHERLPRFQVL